MDHHKVADAVRETPSKQRRQSSNLLTTGAMQNATLMNRLDDFTQSKVLS